MTKTLLANMEWERAPKSFSVTEDSVTLVTESHTDLWQRTYYHFRNDNAPVLQAETEERYFSFTVRVDFSDCRHRYDQAGIAVYLDSENWIKASVEYETEEFGHLGSVVTNGGYSDWATTEFSAKNKCLWFRLSRREEDFRIECSLDGERFSQMRICHLQAASGKVRFGVYACSPEDSSFTARFTDFSFGECVWAAHDGQQPDEE